jgi:hypothetical protein
MHTDIQLTTSIPFQSILTTDSLSVVYDNTTIICAGKNQRKILLLNIENKLYFIDQLTGDLLEGTSGKIIWGIIQLILMILGNIGK